MSETYNNLQELMNTFTEVDKEICEAADEFASAVRSATSKIYDIASDFEEIELTPSGQEFISDILNLVTEYEDNWTYWEGPVTQGDIDSFENNSTMDIESLVAKFVYAKVRVLTNGDVAPVNSFQEFAEALYKRFGYGLIEVEETSEYEW